MWKRLHVKYQLFLSGFNKTYISQQIFEYSSNIKFHQNPSSGSRVGDGRIDGHDGILWPRVKRVNMKKVQNYQIEYKRTVSQERAHAVNCLVHDTESFEFNFDTGHAYYN